MERHIFGVTEVNQLVKLLLDGEPMLQDVYVRGELSNYKMYPSGHHYFTLKDPEGALRCVMFRGQASRLRFRPENGMKVIAQGRITVFPRDGAYQLYCSSLTPEGAGDLMVAFEQLKAKLYAEGLFDPAHKKPLPPYPEKIAVVTSSAGAAGRETAGSAATWIRGRSTPRAASSSREAQSRRVMASTFRLMIRPARFRFRGDWMGPMPQPYIITRQPSRLAAARVKR